jgi:hypothetical protein
VIFPHRTRMRQSSREMGEPQIRRGALISNGTILANIRRIVAELVDEMRRLNHAGVAPAMLRSRSRRESARLIKAALAERYRDHNRCC